jgi:hypothetical protein
LLPKTSLKALQTIGTAFKLNETKINQGSTGRCFKLSPGISLNVVVVAVVVVVVGVVVVAVGTLKY